MSALIHAATMVTAGVYMVARLAPLYSLSETAMTVVAVVGTATAIMGATIALVQTDIKKVLAYSTVSQLGYMFLALGVGAFGVAVFHLFTHAFFKALLFLGSGSVIHATGGEQDMRRMGGLWRRIPWTFWTFLIGTLAIAGIPPLAGYHSKDAILAGALAGHWNVLFAIGLLTAILTAFYMGRLLILTFFGEYRGDAATESHIHESPWSMLAPLVAARRGQHRGRLRPHRRDRAAGLPAGGGASSPRGVAALRRHRGRGAGARRRLLSLRHVPRPARADRPRLRGPARVLEAKYGFDALYDRRRRPRVRRRQRQGPLARGGRRPHRRPRQRQRRSGRHRVPRRRAWCSPGLVRAYALLILGGAAALFAYLLWSRSEPATC